MGGVMTDPSVALGRRPRWVRPTQVLVAVLASIVLAFVVNRLLIDIPHLRAGTVPDGFDRTYVEHPWLAYLHIAPGVLYLLGAPLQLSYRIRGRHYTLHRRLGRVLLVSALASGVFALVFGVRFAFGGVGEASATVLFGTWFLVCLVLAFRAIRRGDVVHHRRWMIRAFAIGIGIGTIRLWIGLFMGAGLLSLHDSFAIAFWLSFAMHAAAGEAWLRAAALLPEVRPTEAPGQDRAPAAREELG